MITIKQIAEIAGVSPTTVSNYLNGRLDQMSAETLEKVRQVVDEKKYVSNMGGRMLARYGSRLIGVIMTYEHRDEQNVTQDPYFGEMLGALEKAIRASGYFMMFYASAEVEETLRMAASWNVEGLIVVSAKPWEAQEFMRHTEIPVVFTDAYFADDGIDYINVGMHDRNGAYVMTEYLIRMGHRRIAFLADYREPFGVELERLEGCRAALRDHGCSFNDERDYVYISPRHHERHRFLRKFARTQIRDFTALFFKSDFYAVDSMHSFHMEGIQVPRDISICGFDDNIFARLCIPQLTTMQENQSLKAQHALQQLLKRIRGEPVDPLNIRLPVTLVIRDSVANIN